MTSDADENALRYRRAQSVTRAEEITEKEKKARKSQVDRPCHKPRDSLFWSNEFTDFTGLVNWGFLMLSIGGVRLGLENFLKYGFRVNPIEWIILLTGYNEGQNNQYPSLILLMFSIVPIIICLLLEKAIAVSMVMEKIGMILQITNIIFVISLPVAVLHYKGEDFSFVGITSICMLYLVIFLKLWSYVQTNGWCRHAMKTQFKKTSLRRQSLSAPNWNELINADNDQTMEEDESGPSYVKYPENLNVKDLFYFLFSPTLCYELNFPRTTRIRKRFLIKSLLEVIFGINLMMALFQQWMIPSITNSLIPFSQMDFVRIAERLLKLSIPNHLLWLCFFYLMFHSFLNLMGELLHFADRNFYCDWWNANNIEVFWRTWNMPVHRWAVRHVYIPMTKQGYSKIAASTVVFFISAFFHEYLVSVPLQMFRIWAFLGMMSQIPLSLVSRIVEKKLGPRWGNIIVWSSLVLGQPLAIMMYYHDYAIVQMSPQSPV